MLSLEVLNCREGCLHGCQWTELFICSSHSSQEESRPTAHKWVFMGSHCCNIWGACECGGQGVYWWVCLLAPLTFTRLTENVSECQMLALVMMQLLKSLSYWSIASLPSPNSRLLSPCPFTCLFSLSSSSPSLLLPCEEQPTPVKDQKS